MDPQVRLKVGIQIKLVQSYSAFDLFLEDRGGYDSPVPRHLAGSPVLTETSLISRWLRPSEFPIKLPLSGYNPATQS